MSEYQYYEFRALDRRLTPDQQRRLRSLSTRAEISATRFANEYSFGNFRGDPGRLVEEYFDAYLYAANWGTRELAFRLPRTLLDAQTARRYCDEEYRAWVTETTEHVVVRFRWDDDEGDDWIEGNGLLEPLLAAHGELAAGDTRLLYLGWLLTVQLRGFDEDDDDENPEDNVEPPVPAGLKELSDSLACVAEFLKIDGDLIAAAAKASGPLAPVSDDGIADWVTALPSSEKDKFLMMVAEGEGAQVEALLAQQFRRESRPQDMAVASTGRTASGLLAGAEARRSAREAAKAQEREEAGHDGRRSRPQPTSATWRNCRRQGRGMAAGGEANHVLQAERIRPSDTAPERPARGRAAGRRHRGVHCAGTRAEDTVREAAIAVGAIR